MTHPHKWLIHGERLLDDTPHIRVSLADVELPNHVRFTQHVLRMRRCAMTVVLDEPSDQLLLTRRHRFIVDRWVWELPGGYVNDAEDSLAAAAREVEEETGWHPRGLEFVVSCQPLIGNADYPQDLYLARGAELVGELHVDETAEVRWMPLEETPEMIARGDILGAITIIGVQQALLLRAAALHRQLQIHHLERTLPSRPSSALSPQREHLVPAVTFHRTKMLIKSRVKPEEQAVRRGAATPSTALDRHQD